MARISSAKALIAGAIAAPSAKADEAFPWQAPEACWYGRTPTDKQRLFVAKFLDEGMTEGGFGGAYGGGKTVGLSFLAAALVTRFPGCRLLLGRKFKSSLEKTTLPEFKAMAEGLRDNYGLEFRYFYGANTMTFIFKTHEEERWQSRIELIELKDETKIQGASVDGALLDEGSELSPKSWHQIAARVRGSTHNPSDGKGGRAWPVLIAWGGNPLPGYAHKNYIVPWMAGDLEKGFHAKRFFIPSSSSENPHNEAGYVGRMRAAGVHENFIAGVWDFSDGNVFRAPESMFRQIDEYALTGKPRGTSERSFGYDYGKLHEAAIVAGFVHAGTAYVYSEFIKREMLIEEASDFIKENGDGVVYADKSTAWQKRATHIGSDVHQSVATLFLREGVSLTPANEGPSSSVFATIRLLKDMIHHGCVIVDPDGCPLLCEAIRLYSHEVTDSGDYNPLAFSEELKDRIDALRYLIINLEPLLTYKRPDAECADVAAPKRRDPDVRPGIVERAKRRQEMQGSAPPWMAGVGGSFTTMAGVSPRGFGGFIDKGGD